MMILRRLLLDGHPSVVTKLLRMNMSMTLKTFRKKLRVTTWSLEQTSVISWIILETRSMSLLLRLVSKEHRLLPIKLQIGNSKATKKWSWIGSRPVVKTTIAHFSTIYSTQGNQEQRKRMIPLISQMKTSTIILMRNRKTLTSKLVVSYQVQCQASPSRQV